MSNLSSTLGDYRILSLAGRSATASVYRAKHVQTGLQVALKRIDEPGEAMLMTLRREVQVLTGLRHPGVVRILDSGEHEGLPWIAMELVEGTTLREVLQSRRDWPLAERLTLVRRLCAPLAYLHSEGIVHRDLKPENVMVSTHQQPVLVDFGVVARFASRQSREALEVETEASGTLLYMAPEQIVGELLDARADLYALGCVIDELVTGQPPFSGRPWEVVRGHQNEAPRAPSELAPGVSAELDDLVLRLLAKERRNRIGYAEDVASVLAAMDPGAEGGLDETATRPRPYLYRPEFSGREEAMQVLLRAVKQLAAGRGGLVFLIGESGIGKTRLAMEAARHAERHGVRVLTGECTQTTPERGVAGTPLQAIRKALQAVADRCRERGVEETERLTGRHGKLLALYEPAFIGLPGHDLHPEPSELSADAARLRLFSVLAKAFTALAKDPEIGSQSTLLLVLDDLQWADELTLGWLTFLLEGKHLESAPLLLLATVRSEEIDAPLQKLMDGVADGAVHLGRLEARAVGDMVADMLALKESPQLFVQFMARHSEGNPFFVAEYLRTAVEEQVLFRDVKGRWQLGAESDSPSTAALYEALPLPGSIRELVRRRLDSLDPGTRQMVEVAAVLGREVDPRLLVSMTSSGAAGHIQLLLARQVLEEVETGRLRFVHDKIREVAYERISAGRLNVLHRAAAEEMERRFSGQDEHLAVLAHHWERSGEAAKAREYSLAGARFAKRRYAYGEAEGLYRTYLGFVAEPTLESILARNELGFDVLCVQGRNLEALREHAAALEESGRLKSRLGRAHSLQKKGIIHYRLGETEPAASAFKQALADFREEADRRSEGVTLSNMGLLFQTQGKLEEARASYEDALRLFREDADSAHEGIALTNLASLFAVQGRWEENRNLLEQALRLHRQTGNRMHEGIALGNLGSMHSEQGRLDEALELLEQAARIHREVGNRRSEGIALTNMGSIHAGRRQWDSAAACLEKALAIQREGGNRRSEGIILTNLGKLFMEEGRGMEARAAFDQALALHRQVSNREFEGRTLTYRATLERRLNEIDTAVRLNQEAASIVHEVGAKFGVGLCACEAGYLALACGQPAGEYLRHAEELVSQLGSGPESELGKEIEGLRRAVEAFDAGRPLHCGECVDEVPEGLRLGFRETGRA